MKIHRNSLSMTLDSINEDIFFGRKTTRKDREELAQWIAGRQGKPGAYANMFAPMKMDVEKGLKLFTGEVIRSSASLRHVSGEESIRVLILLGSRSKAVKESLQKARTGIQTSLKGALEKQKEWFCCGTCDPSLWRNIAVGGLPGSEVWLKIGMKTLKAHRDKEGRWNRFPFFYTVLALSEIDTPEAIREMRYAAKSCEKYLRNTKPSRPTTVRRRAVVEKVLNLV